MSAAADRLGQVACTWLLNDLAVLEPSCTIATSLMPQDKANQQVDAIHSLRWLLQSYCNTFCVTYVMLPQVLSINNFVNVKPYMYLPNV